MRLVLAVLATVAFQVPAAFAAEVPEPRSLNVSETAEVAAAPDRARLSIAVVTSSKDARAAADENARAAARVVEAMTGAVGAAGEVKTGSYSLRPDYQWNRREEQQQRVLKGYIATNQVLVTTDDLSTVGSLVDAAVAAGANDVGQVEFFLADREAVERQATMEAGRRARATAETLAESLGVGLGPLLEASSSSSGGAPLMVGRAAMMEASMDAATPIEAGNIRVHATVSARFEIR
jgi:uncharacterized protein YggE